MPQKNEGRRLGFDQSELIRSGDPRENPRSRVAGGRAFFGASPPQISAEGMDSGIPEQEDKEDIEGAVERGVGRALDTASQSPLFGQLLSSVQFGEDGADLGIPQTGGPTNNLFPGGAGTGREFNVASQAPKFTTGMPSDPSSHYSPELFPGAEGERIPERMPGGGQEVAEGGVKPFGPDVNVEDRKYGFNTLAGQSEALLAEKAGIHVPTVEEYRESAGIEEPKWWQKILMGGIYGGPEQAQAAMRARMDRGYQEHIQGATQDRAAIDEKMAQVKSFMGENIRRVKFNMGDGTFVRLPETQAGYIMGTLHQIQKWVEEKGNMVNLRDVMSQLAGPGAGPDPGSMPDVKVTAETAVEITKLWATFHDPDGPKNFTELVLQEFALDPEERWKKIPEELAMRLLDQEMGRPGGSTSAFQLAQNNPEAYQQLMLFQESTKRAATDALPAVQERPSPLEKDKLREQYTGTGGNRSPFMTHALRSLGFPGATNTDGVGQAGKGDDGEVDLLSEGDRSLYAENEILMEHMDTPKYRKAAEARIKKFGLFFKGDMYKPKTAASTSVMYSDFKRQLAAQVGKKVGDGSMFETADMEMFLIHFFPLEHAAEAQGRLSPGDAENLARYLMERNQNMTSAELLDQLKQEGVTVSGAKPGEAGTLDEVFGALDRQQNPSSSAGSAGRRSSVVR
jgi:hypothetical protein